MKLVWQLCLCAVIWFGSWFVRGGYLPSSVTFTVHGGSVKTGNEIKVPITVKGFTNVTTARFTLAWNADELEFQRAEDFGVTLSSTLDTSTVSRGYLVFDWFDPNWAEGQSLDEDATLLAVVFKANASQQGRTAVSFSDEPQYKFVSFGGQSPISGLFVAENGTVQFVANQAPILGTIADQTIDEDASTEEISLLATDPDDPPASLGYKATSSDQNLIPDSHLFLEGTSSAPTLRAVPLPDANGTAIITVTVSDGSLDTSREFKVNVTPVNDPPTLAEIEDMEILEDTTTPPITIEFADIDTPVGDLIITVDGKAAEGSGYTRTITVTPAPNQFGIALVRVTVNDGEFTAEREFQVHVLPVNDPPTITTVEDQLLAEDTPSAEILFIIDDVDTAGADLTVTATSSDTVLIPLDNIVISGEGSDRTVTITPAPDAYGDARITIVVSDGELSAETTFRVTVEPVDDPPTISPIADQIIKQDSATEEIEFIIGDADTPASDLTVEAESDNLTLVPLEGIYLSETEGHHSVRIVPAAGQTGSALITLTVRDLSGGTAVSSFNVSVRPVVLPPVIGSIPDQVIDEDEPLGPLVIPLSEGETVSGTLIVEAASSDTDLIPSLVIEELNGQKVLTATPAPNRSGSATIFITVRSPFVVTGLDATEPVAQISFVLTVREVNDPPIVGDDSYSVLQGQSLNIPEAGLFENDSSGPSDEDAQILTIVDVDAASLHGGMVEYVDAVIKYTPAPGFTGLDSFAYTVGDDGTTRGSADPRRASGTVFITVNQANQAPVVAEIKDQTVAENKTMTLQVVAFDPDTVPNKMRFLLDETAPAGAVINPVTGVFSWTPSEVQGPGSYPVIVHVTDDGFPGMSTTRSFIVTVQEVNQPPSISILEPKHIAEGETLRFTVSAVDEDIPANRMQFSLVGNVPSGAHIDPDTGEFTWTPGETQGPGVLNFEVSVTDGVGGSAVSPVSVTVQESNQPPTVGAVPEQIIPEGTLWTLVLAASDPDRPENHLTFSLESGAPAGLQINPSTGLLSWTPTEVQGPGDYQIFVRVSDDGTPPASTVQNIIFHVREVNAPPEMPEIPPQQARAGTLFRLTVNAKDIDLPANQLAFRLEPGAPAGADIDPTSGVLTWTPSENDIGRTFPIGIRVTDDGVPAESVVRVLTVSVTEANRLPRIAQIEDQAVPAGAAPFPVIFIVGDTETPAEKIRISAHSSNPELIPDQNIVFGGTGVARNVTVTPLPDQTGFSDITVTAEDEDGGRAAMRFRVMVVPVAPTIVRDQVLDLRMAPGAPLSLDVRLLKGTPPFLFQWKRNGQDIPGATQPVLNLGNVQAASTGEYSVTVTNAAGVDSAVIANVSLNGAARFTAFPPNYFEVREGATAQFAVAASGQGPITYQLWRDSQLLLERMSPAVNLPFVTVNDTGDYTIVVKNSLGSAVAKSSLKVLANPQLIRSSPLMQGVVAGDPLKLQVVMSGTEPLLYEWSFNGKIIDGATSSVLVIDRVSKAHEGNYRVRIRYFAGEYISLNMQVTVSEPLTITAQPADQAVTAGSTATFKVAAVGPKSLNYQWRFNGVNMPGATNDTLNVPNAQPFHAGDYSVEVSSGGLAAISAQAKLTVNEPVRITLQPSSQTALTGGDARFDVVARGTGPIAYQWRFNGAAIPGQTGASLALPNLSKANEGAYSVMVSNLLGVVFSAEAALRVQTLPSIETQPASQTVSLGQSVVFTVSAGGDEPIEYQWLKNGANLPGATASSFTIPNVQPDDAGDYSVIVKNEAGAVTSLPATLTLVLPSISMSDTFANSPLLDGQAGTFDGGSNTGATKEIGEPSHAGDPGGKSVWLRWRAPGSGIASVRTRGSNFDTTLGVYLGNAVGGLVRVAGDDDGGGFATSAAAFSVVQGAVYHIAVDGVAGSRGTAASGRIVISIELERTADVLPQFTFDPQMELQGFGNQSPFRLASLAVPAAEQFVVEGSSVTFRVGVTGQNLAFQWFRNGEPVPGANAATLTIDSVQAGHVGTYFLRVTAGAGATARSVDSKSINLQIGGVTEDKFTHAVLVDVGPVLASVRPRPGSSPRGSVARGYSGAQVFSTMGSSKEPGEPNHANVVGGASQWFTYQAPASGALKVTTDGSDFDTVLAVYTGPGTDFDTLELLGFDNDGGADGQDSLVVVPVTAGVIYYIAVDGVKGASGTVKLDYELTRTPVIVRQPAGQTVTVGAHVSLDVVVTNTLVNGAEVPPLTAFQWLKDDAPIAHATNSILVLNNLQISGVGDYRVIVSNFAGAVTSSVARISIAAPLVITVPPAIQWLRAGNTARFSVAASGSEPMEYQWFFENNPIPGATQSMLVIENAQAAHAGSYKVVVRNPVNQVESGDVQLKLEQPPIITAFTSGQSVRAETDAHFAVTAIGDADLRYQWQVNGVNISNATNSSFTVAAAKPRQAGFYSVVVQNSIGVAVSPSAELTVETPIQIASQPLPSQTISVGSSAVFSVVAVGGSGPLSYQWRFGGSIIPGATNASFVIPQVRLQDAGFYDVVIFGAGDVVTSLSGQLIVLDPPIITRQPQGQTIFAGNDATFQVIATGTGPLAFQWFDDDVPIDGATTGTLTLTAVPGEANGHLFKVRVSNAGGSVTSTAVPLEVKRLVSQPALEPDGTFSFRLTIPDGRQGVIEYSTDLINWFPLDPNIRPSGATPMQDTQAPQFDLRYYRVRLE